MCSSYKMSYFNIKLYKADFTARVFTMISFNVQLRIIYHILNNGGKKTLKRATALQTFIWILHVRTFGLQKGFHYIEKLPFKNYSSALYIETNLLQLYTDSFTFQKKWRHKSKFPYATEEFSAYPWWVLSS